MIYPALELQVILLPIAKQCLYITELLPKLIGLISREYSPPEVTALTLPSVGTSSKAIVEPPPDPMVGAALKVEAAT